MIRDTAHTDTATIEVPVSFIDAVSARRSIEEVLQTSGQWLTKIIGCRRCSISFYHDDQLVVQEFCADGSVTTVPVDARAVNVTVFHTAVATLEPQHLDRHAIAEVGGRAFDRLLAAGIDSAVIAPIVNVGEAIGAVAAFRDTPGGFTAQEGVDLINTGKWIGAQISMLKQLRTTRRQSRTDNLTGLANRVRLMNRLSEPGALLPEPETGRLTGILTIDLDHFKTVNDNQGHIAGDAMLIAAARAMRSVTGPHDLVARTGGDEFQIVTRTDTQGHHLAALSAALVETIGQTVTIDGVPTRVGASIGTAMAEAPDCTPDRLIGNSDLALYEVKRAGRGTVRAFTPDMRERHEAALSLMSELQQAVRERSFEPYFQPQVCLATGGISGIEILARWPHPTLGMLGPEAFIDIAVEGRFLDKIDEIVRHKGLTALRELKTDGWTLPKMAFNASTRALVDPDHANRLLDASREQQIHPTDLVLELRDTRLITGPDDPVSRNMRILKEAGVTIAIDHFGTGSASMTQLAMPIFSAIKLDKTLVSRLRDPGGTSIMRASINLAHEFGLKVTEGGVETPSQFSTLRSLGCFSAQGYGIAAPMPLNDLIQFLREYGAVPARLTA